jgi:asparagine synthetase B (glutamine-hydrolysing)
LIISCWGYGNLSESEAASKEISVIFNGEGADKLFAGWTNKPLKGHRA